MARFGAWLKARLWQRWRPIGAGLLAVVLTVTPVALGQDTGCDTEAALRACIERRAVNHANAGEQMYQSDVSEEFADNALGWNRTQIIDIYETAFIEERDRLESDLREFWPLSWITGFAMLLLGASWSFWQEKITAWVALLWNWIYGKVAGNPLFLGWALQRYRQSLQENLKHLPTPFKIYPPLAMEGVYVPLKVKERDGSSATSGLELDIFQALIDNKRLMVVGEPGSGKSVLLRHIAYRYGQGRLDLPGNPIPVRLELNTLRDPELDRPKLVQKLVEVLENYDFPNASGFIQQGLDSGRLLLLLDGLDEVSSTIRPQVVDVINGLLQNEAKECPAVITCRTQVYRNEFDLALGRNGLEVMEFSDAQMRRFLQAWKERMPADKSVEQLMQTLNDRPRIKGIARNPLMLTFITYFYIDPTFELPYSRSGFYEKATNQLLELRDQERNIFNAYSPAAKRQVLRNLALAAQDLLDPNSPDRRSIPDAKVLQVVNGVMPDLNLDASHTAPILQEIVDRSGLLLAIDGGERYQFSHLTLQEFFAAAALQQEPQVLVQRFNTDPAAWREVVKLLCGLAGNSTVVIERVYQREALIGFECLADAQEVDRELADRILQAMQGQLVRAATEESWAKAFGAVAADRRPRGTKLFELLEQQLTRGNGMASLAAANALSMSNLPKAARVLADAYETAPERLGDALVRMGDVAVEALRDLAAAEKNAGAVDELWRIQTPEAAKALASLLWIDGLVISGRAAWRLAALLPLVGVEEELAQYEMPLGKKSELDWVWTPFLRYLSTEPGQLPHIIGRAAELMLETPCLPLERVSDNDENISSYADPRLLIPLCTAYSPAIPPPSLLQADTQTVANLETWLENPQPKDQSLDRNFSPPEVVNVLEPVVGKVSRTSWGSRLQLLKPSLQGKILYRFLKGARWPNRRDWEQLLRPVQTYVFSKRKSYRFILLAAGLASIGAVAEIVLQLSPEIRGLRNGLLAVGTVIIGVFWLALWTGVEESWEPDTFLKLGIQGVRNFPTDTLRVYRRQSLQEIIQALKKGVTSQRMTLALCLVLTVAMVLTWTAGAAGIVAQGVAGAWAVTIGGTWIIAWLIGTQSWERDGSAAGAIVGFGAVIVTGVGTIIIAGIQTVTTTWTSATVRAGAIVFLSILAIVLYEQSEAQGNQDITIPLGQRVVSWFAFLYFCWFPITLWFSFFGLRRLIQALQPSLTPQLSNLPSWVLALLIQAIVLMLCTYLWRTGRARERRARNPLQGILDREYPQYKQRKS